MTYTEEQIDMKRKQLEMFDHWLGEKEWRFTLLNRDMVADEAEVIRRILHEHGKKVC